jgi:two-component system OmpR family sensor kinase
MSLRARLLLILAALATVALVAADIATYAALQSFLLERTDRSLDAASHAVERAARPGGPGGRGPGGGGDLESLGTFAPGVYIEVRDATGKSLFAGALTPPGQTAATPQVPATITGTATTPQWKTVPAVGGGGPDFRLRASRTDTGDTIIVAAPLADTQRTLGRLRIVEVVVGVIAILGLLLVGLVAVAFGLRPLTRIGATAEAIGAGDLTRRVEPAGGRTEIGQLGSALNAMLGQIEDAFAARSASEERLRRFIADASHELRTPVAAVSAYAELFDRGARDRPEDLERAMAGIQRESARIGVLVADLLLLARLDQGRALESIPVDLAVVAHDAVDAAGVVDPAHPVTLEDGEPLQVTGDPHALRQVLDNLLGNIRVHTPAGTSTRVVLRRAGAGALLEVIDDGPGMAPEDAARGFERFYRADPSRTRSAGGSGLGLSIVAAIVEAHGGTASMTSVPGAGTTVTIRLPSTRGEAPPP